MRPTAKELLLDPFIAKSKGIALLSELVANSMDKIEDFRIGAAGNEDEENQNEGIQTFVNDRNSLKTMLRRPQEEGEEVDIGGSGTLVLIEEEVSAIGS